MCIVTNSQEGWVQLSAQCWVPDLLPWLKRIPICHASDMYGSMFAMQQCKRLCIDFILHTYLMEGINTHPGRQHKIVGCGNHPNDSECLLQNSFATVVPTLSILWGILTPTGQQIMLLLRQFQKYMRSDCKGELIVYAIESEKHAIKKEEKKEEEDKSKSKAKEEGLFFICDFWDDDEQMTTIQQQQQEEMFVLE
jgi:hypothetical protein